jgi:hypothetical protein
VSVCEQELDSQPVTTRISVKPQPIVGLRQLEPKPVCLGAKSAVAQFEYWVDNAGSTAQVSAAKPLGEIVAPGSLAALAAECTSEIEGGRMNLSTASVYVCSTSVVAAVHHAFMLLLCVCKRVGSSASSCFVVSISWSSCLCYGFLAVLTHLLASSQQLECCPQCHVTLLTQLSSASVPVAANIPACDQPMRC